MNSSDYTRIKFNWCKIIFILGGTIIIANGCGRQTPDLVIYNSTWPDGTSVSLIDGSLVTQRSKLYGGHTQLSIPKTQSYIIRAASSAHITFMSDTLTIDRERSSFSLPSPVSRRRIGSWRIGLSLRKDLPDSLYEYLLEKAHGSLTTISPDMLHNALLSRIIRKAHAKGIEVTACVHLTANELPDVLSLADSAEVYGVDGIVAQPDSTVLSMAEFSDAMRGLAAALHKRGVTFAVQVIADCGAGSILLPPGIRLIFTEVPDPEMPDELRIAFICTGTPSSVSAERIEEKIGELVKDHIPLSRTSVELALTGFKFRVMDDGDLEPVSLKRGEVQTLLQGSGGYKVIRLRDGSLRLGYRGAFYAFDDIDGMAYRISRLRTGGLSRSGGIHIVYDGLGVAPDPEHIKRLAKSVRTP